MKRRLKTQQYADWKWKWLDELTGISGSACGFLKKKKTHQKVCELARHRHRAGSEFVLFCFSVNHRNKHKSSYGISILTKVQGY